MSNLQSSILVGVSQSIYPDTCYICYNISTYYIIIVRNLIPFQNLGLQRKTEALFRKVIIDFFVAFYPYFTMVKFFRVRSPLRSPQDCNLQSDKPKKRKNPCKSQIYGLLSEIISIISFPVTDLKCVQLLRYLYGAPYGAPGLQKAK